MFIICCLLVTVYQTVSDYHDCNWLVSDNPGACAFIFLFFSRNPCFVFPYLVYGSSLLLLDLFIKIYSWARLGWKYCHDKSQIWPFLFLTVTRIYSDQYISIWVKSAEWSLSRFWQLPYIIHSLNLSSHFYTSSPNLLTASPNITTWAYVGNTVVCNQIFAVNVRPVEQTQ